MRPLLNKERFYIILIWLLLTSVFPFTFYVQSWHPYKKLSFVILCLLSLFLVLKKNIKIGNKSIITIWVLQIIFFILWWFIHSDVSFIALIIQNIAILITYLFIINFLGSVRFSKSLVYTISFLGVLGLIGFILALIGMQPIARFVNPDGRTAYNFIFTFTNSVYFLGGKYLIRYSSYFDEPGALAFYLTLALILNKSLMDNKKVEIVLIVCGIMTFSLAFIICLFSYLILYYFKKRNLSYFILMIVIMTIVFGYITFNKNSSLTSKYVYSMSVGRINSFVFGEANLNYEANNRAPLVENAFKVFVNHPLLGYGPSNVNEDFGFMAANIIVIFAYYGLIGSIFVTLFLFYIICYCFRYKDKYLYVYKNPLLVLLLILILYSQRPDFFGLLPNMFFAMIIHSFISDISKSNFIKIDLNKIKIFLNIFKNSLSEKNKKVINK